MRESWRLPGEPGHSYRIKTEVADATYTGPDEWLKTVPPRRRIVVAGMDEVAGRAIRRAIRAAADGHRNADEKNLPDAPGDYVRH